MIVEDCECDRGWLVEQTYGFTAPPEGSVVIQRCDLCERYPGDIDAAVAFAEVIGGRVFAIGDGEMMAPQSDAWVELGGKAGPVIWFEERAAIENGWYVNPEESP